MNDFEIAAFALDRMAARLEGWEPDRFTKEIVVAFVRKAAEVIAEDNHSFDAEESYRQQLRLCREHGMICFEYYRRRRGSDNYRFLPAE